MSQAANEAAQDPSAKEVPAQTLTEAELKEIDRRMAVMFNVLIVNTFKEQTILPHNAQHLPLYTMARVIGELIGLFCETPELLEQGVIEAMRDQRGKLTLVPQEKLNIKIQQLVDFAAQGNKKVIAPKKKIILPH